MIACDPPPTGIAMKRAYGGDGTVMSSPLHRYPYINWFQGPWVLGGSRAGSWSVLPFTRLPCHIQTPVGDGAIASARKPKLH